MAARERSLTISSTDCEFTSCSDRDDQHATKVEEEEDEERRQPDDFVIVRSVEEELQRSGVMAVERFGVPRTRVRTSNPAEGVDIAMGRTGLAAEEPITIGALMQQTVARVPPHHVALRYKTGETWNDVTYREYYDRCISAAKSFLALGLQPFQVVVILGFNSVQWHVSALGTIFAGGLSCGIHATSTTEDCHAIAMQVTAAVVVVEDHAHMCKFLIGKLRGKLPKLKAIVQYTGKLVKQHQNVYDWEQFLELGADMETSQVEDRMKSQTPNQCASLVYTSGTTGDPKVVMLSHDNLTWSAKSLLQTYKSIEFACEHMIGYLPLSHIAAQVADIYVAITAAMTVHIAQPDALKGSLAHTLKEVQPTVFFGVPRVYGKMMERIQEVSQAMSGLQRMVVEWSMRKGLQGNQNKQNNEPVPWGWTAASYLFFSRVRRELGFQRCKLFAVGGATTRTDIYEYLMSLNMPMMNFYGMSESCGAHCVNQSTEDHWRMGSAGKNIMAVSTKLHDTDDNEEGEICFSGRHVFMGYLGEEERTAEAIDSQGWLHTGDIGRFDENGFLHVTGRIRDVIILSGGTSVLPLVIENHVLSEVPFLSHVVVVGERRDYLTCLMTLKCVMDTETGEPTDTLAPVAEKMMAALGSTCRTVSGVIRSRERAVFTAITEGLDRANAHALSSTHKILKWTLLDADFSIPGGELGPTLKVRRFIVHERYADTIEALYQD